MLLARISISFFLLLPLWHLLPNQTAFVNNAFLNSPPNIPNNPYPANRAVFVNLTPTLTWNCDDPDGDLVTYTIYFGTNNPPVQVVSSNQMAKSYTPPPLTGGPDDFGTNYYWQVVAKDSTGQETAGPVWTFKTEGWNHAPSGTSVISPADGSVWVSTTPTLHWMSEDVDGDYLTYTVYLEAEANTPGQIVSAGSPNNFYSPPPLLDGVTYYWMIKATDSMGLSNTSYGWSFTTRASSPSGTPEVYQPNARWREAGVGAATGPGLANSFTYFYYHPQLVTTSNGTTYMLWCDFDGQIFMLRWDGHSWVKVVGPWGSNSPDPYSLGLPANLVAAADGSGNIYAAWTYTVGDNTRIAIMKWTGDHWIDLGFLPRTIPYSINPYQMIIRIAVSPGGMPYVAWSEKNNNDNLEVYITRWDGSAWGPVSAGSDSGGGISNTTTISRIEAITFGSDGALYVAWSEDYTPVVYIKKFSAGIWQDLNSGTGAGGLRYGDGSEEVTSMALAVAPNGMLYTVYTATGAKVKRWSGSTWDSIGQVLPAMDYYSVSLAFFKDNLPMVVGVVENQMGGTREIMMWRWDGKSWVAVGGGVEKNGPRNTPGLSAYPSIAFLPDGTPFVAWSEHIDSVGDTIYGKAYSSKELVYYFPFLPFVAK